MIGLVLTVIGYVIAIAWAVWRVVRVPSVNIHEQDMTHVRDTVAFSVVLLLGAASSRMTGSTPMLRLASLALMVIAMLMSLVTLATEIKFMHLDK